jgi:hypothetical protein
MGPAITITGFPICGATALKTHFEADSEADVLHNPVGGLETRWPLLRDMRPASAPTSIQVHKFTAYIYNANALDYLVKVNPNGIFVLCTGDPSHTLGLLKKKTTGQTRIH